MNTKILAVALAALLVAAGGAAAVGSTVASDADQPDTRDADIEATYDGGNVTVTVTNGGDPVPNATVEVGDGEYTTDANGTVTAPVEDDEVDVEVEAPGFEGEHEYALVDGELVLQEETFEYDVESEDGDDESDEEDEEADDAEEDADEDEDVDEDGEEQEDDDDDEEDEETEQEDDDDEDEEDEDDTDEDDDA